LEAISMMKIVISTATTLMAAALLVACNGDGTNASDVSSLGTSTPLEKVVCTNSNNWQSVGIGMNASQVQARLGAPARIVAVSPNTEYQYERCRAGLFVTKKATLTEPEERTTFYFTGVVVISGNRGVISVTPPLLSAEFPMICEWDLYRYPTNYGNDINECRTSQTPF
jgi:hypothetical protein